MSEDAAEKFLEHPEDFMLFRGERPDNQTGLHFTTDEKWSKNFGTVVRAGRLPTGSKIKLLEETDKKDAFERGIFSEQELWDSIFEQGYDAILGHDAMNRHMLDIIVNPKHLSRFQIKRTVK